MLISIPNDSFESGGELEPLECGIYRAVICTPEYKKSKGDPEGPGYFNVPFKMDVDGVERTVWSNYSLKQNSLWKLAELVKSAGIPYEEGDGGAIVFDSDDLDGCEVMVEVGTDTWQDKLRNTVENTRPLT
jgi:hypothetical protein